MPAKPVIKRHAYMIAAHKNQEQLELLLKLLDTEANDIYLHIDAKTDSFDLNRLKSIVKLSKLYLTDRISVQWARYSIVESTLIMLKAAHKNGPYSYYHLLSGQDLPLKPIKEINKFYDSNDQNNLYVEYIDNEWSHSWVSSRQNYHRFFNGKEKFPITKIKGFVKKVYNFITNKSESIKYVHGAAWFDINESLVAKILEHEQWIKDHFYYFSLPDETFLQTMILKLGLTEYCRDYMRYIDWESGPPYPYTFHANDFNRLTSSGKNFARKFDMDTDREIIDKLFEYIMGQ